MITEKKLNEYKTYNGYYDGYYMQKVKNNIQIISDNEWALIDNLWQDLIIINKGLASKEFTIKVEKVLKDNFDNEGTINQLKEFVKEKL